MSQRTQAIGAAILVLLTALWNPWVAVVIALAALAWFVYLHWSEGKDKTYIPEFTVRKQENLEHVMEMAKEKGSVANDDIEHTLGVSDATAERYLNELEKEGKLIQEGTTGRSVTYTLK